MADLAMAGLAVADQWEIREGIDGSDILAFGAGFSPPLWSLPLVYFVPTHFIRLFYWSLTIYLSHIF